MTVSQKPNVQFGLIIAAILIIEDIILQLAHLKSASWVLGLNSGILAVGVVASIILIDKKEGEILPFSQRFGFGFQVTGATVCILFIYTALSVYIVFPESINAIYESNIADAKLHVTGFDANKADKDKALAIKVLKITSMSMLVMANLAVGILASLVGSVLAGIFAKTGK